jgi:hypothetical protein
MIVRPCVQGNPSISHPSPDLSCSSSASAGRQDRQPRPASRQRLQQLVHPPTSSAHDGALPVLLPSIASSSPAWPCSMLEADSLKTSRIHPPAKLERQRRLSHASGAPQHILQASAPPRRLPSSHLYMRFSSRDRPCSPSDGTDTLATLKASGAASDGALVRTSTAAD